jgi:phosphatidylcholine synthase
MMTTVHDAIDVEGAPSAREQWIAWSVHLFTATGAIWGFLSVIDISQQNWGRVFVWVAMAILVDAFDGYIARGAQVRRILPNFDGALLDNMVDYLNYVFVPAYFLYAAGLLPAPLELALPIVVLLASAYQFSQSDAKTDDHFFKGFPSYWNIVIFYMFMLNLDPVANALILFALSVMVFVPIKYVYPSRSNILPRLTIGLGLIWMIVNVVIWVRYPSQPPWLVWVSLSYPAYYYCLSFYAMYKLHRQTLAVTMT